MKVLFVEDEESVRESAYLGLSQEHDVDMASNGSEARDMLEQTEYDAVVTDIHMPRIDGFGNGADLIDYMVKRGGRHTPIIVITGYSDIAEQYAEFGCVEVLQKPLDIRDVLLLLRLAEKKVYGNCSRCTVGQNVLRANNAVQDILAHLGLSDESRK